MKGNDTEAEYTVNQLARVLNISRTTLLYYEDVGLVTPERKDKSNYRVYRNKDVLNLMNIIMLRNIGLGTEEIAELKRNGDPLSEENISSYCDHLTERIEYLEAVRTALTNYRAERGQSDDPFAIADVPRYYYALSNCDQGWDQFNKTPVTDELLAHMPLTGIGAIYDEDIFQEGRTIRWGRFVAEENLRFLAIDPSELLSIGGCRCLIVRVWGGASLQTIPVKCGCARLSCFSKSTAIVPRVAGSHRACSHASAFSSSCISLSLRLRTERSASGPCSNRSIAAAEPLGLRQPSCYESFAPSSFAAAALSKLPPVAWVSAPMTRPMSFLVEAPVSAST